MTLLQTANMELPAHSSLVYFLFLIISSADGINWNRKSAFDNKLPMFGYNTTSRSRIHCGDICSSNDTCVSFFFAPSQHSNCQLHSYILSSANGIRTVSTTKYYISDEASPSTSALWNIYPIFRCLPDDNIFRTDLLADGSYFTYRVFKDSRTQADAKTACSLQGAFLARVTTVHTMKTLLDLFNCSDYNGPDYYIDGSNANANDFNAADAWTMSNGDPVPMTDFWGPGFPNEPASQHCLRMKAFIGYKLDDTDCRNSFYFVCEK